MFIKRNIILVLISFLFSQLENEKLYITIQMMDQVGIINTETNQIETIIETEFSDMSSNSCMEINDEMMCDMMDGCEWMMGMCMETSLEDCMDYNTEMDCNMAECIWMNDHCMDVNDSCMDINDEMMCDMMDGCEWMMGMCMESMNSDQLNTPHFIVMDEQLGYWFVTTIASGYIAQYSLINNELIDKHFVGDAPAILAIDTINKKIYCSRMMPMNGMGNMMPSSESNVIQSLDYSVMGLSESIISEYQIGSPAPHGIAINNNGTELYTASNTTDWLYKINLLSGEVIGIPMDDTIGNPQDQVTQRLKPIQCLSVGNRLFVTCSAGVWYNPFTGENTIIPGQLQLWDSDNMQLLDSIEFGDYTGPWHIENSPISNTVYIALSGDNLYDTEGLAAVNFNNDILSLDWQTNNLAFDTLHGVDVSSDGQKIYVSGRGDGYIHIFNNSGDYINAIYTGGMSMLGGICITKKLLPAIGDSNNDGTIDVVDIVKIVNSILSEMMMLSPYEFYASDASIDDIINVTDIVAIINIIFDI